MRVVISGGSGLIGRALCSALLARGDGPVVLSRDPDRAARRVPRGTRVVHWDATSIGVWLDELPGSEAIVNLAGESIGRWPWTAGRRQALVESRVVATRTLVDALRSIPPVERPLVLLNASGTDQYEGRDAVPATETTAPADTFLGRLCEAWETEARRAEDLGTRVVLLRMSPVIAPGAPFLRRLTLPFRLFVGGRLGSGRQWWSWVDIADLVGLYLWALDDAEIGGPVNVTAPDARPQSEVARTLGAVMGRPSWFPTPAPLIRLVLGQQATLALGSRRVWPARALAAGYAFRRPRLEESLTAALRG
jgi:uncharacterized protein